MSSSWIRHTARVLLLSACVQLSPSAFADNNDLLKPSTPPALKQPEVMDAFRCERQFLYKGKILDCDSNVQRDAERLRPIVQDVPAAVAELDIYQRKRQNMRVAAYGVSAGLMLVLVGGLLLPKNFFENSGGSVGGAGIPIRGFSLAAGGGMTLFWLGYGYFKVITNGPHIDQAVQ